MFFKYFLIFLCTFISISKSDYRRIHIQDPHSISNLNKVDDQVQQEVQNNYDSNGRINLSAINGEKELRSPGSNNQSSEISDTLFRYMYIHLDNFIYSMFIK